MDASNDSAFHGNRVRVDTEYGRKKKRFRHVQRSFVTFSFFLNAPHICTRIFAYRPFGGGGGKRLSISGPGHRRIRRRPVWKHEIPFTSGPVCCRVKKTEGETRRANNGSDCARTRVCDASTRGRGRQKNTDETVGGSARAGGWRAGRGTRRGSIGVTRGTTRRQRPVVRDSPPSLDRDRGIRAVRGAHAGRRPFATRVPADATDERYVRTATSCRAGPSCLRNIDVSLSTLMYHYLRRPTSVKPTKIPRCSPKKKKKKTQTLSTLARDGSSVCADS